MDNGTVDSIQNITFNIETHHRNTPNKAALYSMEFAVADGMRILFLAAHACLASFFQAVHGHVVVLLQG